MEPMDTQKKPAMMARLRNRKGFSLIEMAIVLVIIGIIIAAIVKGQDLIMNANAKKTVASASQWRNLAMTFYDRNGRQPGDEMKNSIIGDQVGEQTAPLTATAEIVNAMEQAPDNPLIVGGISLYMYFGNVAATVGRRNAIIICGAVDCGTVLTADQLELVKAIDTAEDGSADAGLGNFRAFTAAPGTLNPAAPTTASSNNRYATVIDGLVPTDPSGLGAATPWSTIYRGAVWLYERPF